MPRWQRLRELWHRIAGNYTDRLIARATGSVLDVGCGYGKFLLPLKQRGCEVHGVEVNPRCVDFCRAAGIKVFCGTLEHANLPDSFVDSVILSQVLEHVRSPIQTLREIHRVLKPRGRVFVLCPNGDGYLRDLFGRYWHGWHIPFHLYVFTAQTLTRIAEEAGFAVARTETVTPDDFLTTSLKSYFVRDSNGGRSLDRARIFNTLLFRALASPWLRFADLLLPRKGDCLDVELVKT
jgi:SAM-dependent methyltransferase